MATFTNAFDAPDLEEGGTGRGSKENASPPTFSKGAFASQSGLGTRGGGGGGGAVIACRGRLATGREPV